MSYQALARKWRPRHFKEMVGQDAIVRILSNALEQQRLHHAYLFTGTRGVGKTTIARILAKCLNCETHITASPCNTCHTCQTIDAGKFLDLYEVDAASRTRVEDTRELLENVCYPPAQGRYKIYLIDEVHMLSNHSFNALLKTLEEPPEHVKFLLATTDPKRLPITILSRCLQFHLKRISPEHISQQLAHICQAEAISYEDTALQKLAHGADGSMRDALSLLDQAIAYGNGCVNGQDVAEMLGYLSQDDVLPLIQALAAQDNPKVFAHIKQLNENAANFQHVLEEITHCFHRIALAQFFPDANSQQESYHHLAKQFSPEEVQLYYQIALLAKRDLALSASSLQGFEMAMLRMMAFTPGIAKSAVTSTVTDEKTVSLPEKKTVTAADHSWRDMLPKLELSGMAYALAANCTLLAMEGGKVTLALSTNHAPMLNTKLKERLTEALTRYLGQAVQLEMTISADELTTPVKQQQQENNVRLNAAKTKVMQDPNVLKFIEMYDATIDVSLL